MGISLSPLIDFSSDLIDSILSVCNTGDILFMRRFGSEVKFMDSYVAAIDGIAHVALIMPDKMVSDAVRPTGHRITPLKTFLKKFRFEYFMIFRPSFPPQPECLVMHAHDTFGYTAVRSEKTRYKTSHSCTSWTRSLLRHCRSLPETRTQKPFLDNWKDGILPETILQEEEGRIVFEMGCRTCNLPHRILLLVTLLTIVSIFMGP
jgi:hypothetical protein